MLVVRLCKKCKAINTETLARLVLAFFSLVFLLSQASSQPVAEFSSQARARGLFVRAGNGSLQWNGEILSSIVVNIRPEIDPRTKEDVGNENESIRIRRFC